MHALHWHGSDDVGEREGRTCAFLLQHSDHDRVVGGVSGDDRRGVVHLVEGSVVREEQVGDPGHVHQRSEAFIDRRASESEELDDDEADNDEGDGISGGGRDGDGCRSECDALCGYESSGVRWRDRMEWRDHLGFDLHSDRSSDGSVLDLVSVVVDLSRVGVSSLVVEYDDGSSSVWYALHRDGGGNIQSQ